MTVSYNSDVSSVSSMNFLRLLLRWKGSIWKSVYSELIIWSAAYVFVAFVYHLILVTNNAHLPFNNASLYLADNIHKSIPLTFMLAFFVSIIVERWRTIFSNMGWIESSALIVNAFIIAKNEEARLIRRNIIRYLVLAQILTFRDISIRVRRRFPNIDSIQKAGFITDEEEEKLEDIDLVYNKYWVPVNWAIVLVNRANAKGYIASPPAFVSIVQELNKFRTGLATICNFDWVPIPIAYPQVVFFAVRMYFVFCLITRQYIYEKGTKFELVQLIVRPFLAIIEFICLIGWMKVAEALLNPLGEDDDDFESNFLIDKNIFTGMKILDEFDETPEMFQDRFSDPDAVPIYSIDSQKQPEGALVGSVSNVTLAQTTDDIPMVSINPRLSIADISSAEHLRPSIRRRFKSGSTVSARSSIRNSKVQLDPSPNPAPPIFRRQSTEGEQNEAYELDYELPKTSEPTTPTKPGRFFSTNLDKVDEKEEDVSTLGGNSSSSDAISRV